MSIQVGRSTQMVLGLVERTGYLQLVGRSGGTTVTCGNYPAEGLQTDLPQVNIGDNPNLSCRNEVDAPSEGTTRAWPLGRVRHTFCRSLIARDGSNS